MTSPPSPAPALLALVLASALASGQDETDLTSPFSSGSESFGSSVDVSGSFAVIGAPATGAGMSIPGRAYVFEKDGAGVWTQYQMLEASTSNTQFGLFVAIHAGLLAVVEPGSQPRQVHLFEHVPPGQWVNTQTIDADFSLHAGWLGGPVTLDDRWLMFTTSGGMAIFERGLGGWGLHSVIPLPDSTQAVGDVLLEGDRLVVTLTESFGATGVVGGALFHELVGSTWVEVLRLRSEARGYGVAGDMDGERVAICSGQARTALVYDWTDSGVREVAQLPIPGTSTSSAPRSVSVVGDRVTVGVAEGSILAGPGYAVVWTQVDGAWTATQYAPSLVGDLRYGHAAAADGPLTLIGAPGAQVAPGYVHVLDYSLGANVCFSTPTSLGVDAELEVWGSDDVAQEQLYLRARPVPAGELGVFFYGPDVAQQPFGNGVVCVGGGSTGIARLPVVQEQDGHLTHQVDLDAAPSAATSITAGSTWVFQGWFRDPAGGGAGFDLSHAVEVVFP